MTALRDGDRAARLVWGAHDRVVGSEDGELSLGSPVGVVGRAERDEPTHPAALAELDEVPPDQAAEAVTHDVDLGGTGLATDAFDVLPEVTRQLLVVEPGPIREAREVPDA